MGKIINEHIKFENGYRVSIQTSPFHYTSGDGSDAEIAIFNKYGEFVTNQWKDCRGDDVIGWQSPEDVTSALVWAASQD